MIPSGKLTLWEITIFHGKIHYKWPCSIAMLVYQRVFAGGTLCRHKSSSQNPRWLVFGYSDFELVQHGNYGNRP